MDYGESLKYIDEISGLGSKLDLERITEILERLGRPQDRLKVIHVAGTNGKGSTSSMINHMLVLNGYKTALYTSPHLIKYNERYVIDNSDISDEDFAKYVTLIREKAEQMEAEGCGHPTVFEQLTAVAFKYFADNNVDYAVIEVGLGGRFDATNVIKKPVLSVITSISFDHTEFLGNTLESIAFEKGGIIKEGRPTVLYRQDKKVYDTISKLCEERHSKLYYCEEESINVLKQDLDGTVFDIKNRFFECKGVKLPLVGDYQINNCKTALLAAYALKENGVKLDDEKILAGIAASGWDGRMEVCVKNPTVIIDGAHNPDGINMLVESVKKYFASKRIVLLMGVLGDKDYENMAAEIVPLAETVVITQPASERALSADGFKQVVEKYCENVYCIEEIDEAYKKALEITGKDDVLVCAGSLYLIGELRRIIVGGK